MPFAILTYIMEKFTIAIQLSSFFKIIYFLILKIFKIKKSKQSKNIILKIFLKYKNNRISNTETITWQNQG